MTDTTQERDFVAHLRAMAEDDLRAIARDILIMGITADPPELRGWADLMDKAADLIEAKDAEIERLRAQAPPLPFEATDSMCGYAKHRYPELSHEQARGIWHCMADQARSEMRCAQAPALSDEGLVEALATDPAIEEEFFNDRLRGLIAAILASPHLTAFVERKVEEGRAEEREACAQKCDEVATAGGRWRSQASSYLSHEATSACTQHNTAKGLAAAIRSRGPSPTYGGWEPKDETGRSPKDYAIEHAHYMADGSLQLIRMICDEDSEGVSDAAREVNSLIYEFRKRARRAGCMKPLPPPPTKTEGK